MSAQKLLKPVACMHLTKAVQSQELFPMLYLKHVLKTEFVLSGECLGPYQYSTLCEAPVSYFFELNRHYYLYFTAIDLR